MRNTLSQRLRAAVEAFTAARPDAPGAWTVEDRDGGVMLVWRAAAQDDALGDMYGDEPWKRWGGEEIAARAGLTLDNAKSGVDSYVDRWGEEVLAQWVLWDDDDETED